MRRGQRDVHGVEVADDADLVEVVLAEDGEGLAGLVGALVEVEEHPGGVAEDPLPLHLLDAQAGRVEGHRPQPAVPAAARRLAVAQPVFEDRLRRAEGGVLVEVELLDEAQRLPGLLVVAAEVLEELAAVDQQPAAVVPGEADLVRVEGAQVLRRLGGGRLLGRRRLGRARRHGRRSRLGGRARRLGLCRGGEDAQQDRAREAPHGSVLPERPGSHVHDRVQRFCRMYRRPERES